MKKVIVRTAGGDGGGAGHIHRMSTLVEWLVRLRGDLEFEFWIEGPQSAVDWARGNGFPCLSVGETFNLLKERKFVEVSRADIFIVDQHVVSEEQLQIYKNSNRPVVLFDDMNRGSDCCNLVIQSQNLTGQISIDEHVLKGPNYFVLSPRYSDLRRNERIIEETPRHLLISLGGEACLAGLEVLRNLIQGVQRDWGSITWILGRGGSKIEASLRSALPNVEFCCFVNDIEKKLFSADLAIIAGGFVKYEAACCGTPAVILAQYRHQEILSKEFARTGAATYLGNLFEVHHDMVAETISKLKQSLATRREMSRKGMKLVDGRGGERTAAAIGNLLNL